MKKRIISYVKRIDGCLDGTVPVNDWGALMQEHLTQISFFQHERLIHLMVTVLFAAMTVATVLTIVITGYLPLAILAFLMIVLLVPYVKHYYLLENDVQKMYVQYDKMLIKCGKKGDESQWLARPNKKEKS